MTKLFFNGWATPTELFKSQQNFICQKDFRSSFKAFRSQKFHVIGYSMGCHAAINFCLNQPQLIHKISLIAYRKHYPTSEIELMCKNLTKNARSTLIHFYKQSIPALEDWKYFKTKMLDIALQSWSSQYLIDLLKYANAHFNHSTLENLQKPITFFHADNDIIAPLSELKPLLKAKDRYIQHSYGHMPFLNTDFPWDQL